MFITRLILAGYWRLAMPGINYLEIRPTEIYQIILGTNGSGKSSILRELNPFPADSKGYRKDGYKQFECTHRGSTYKLLSTFSNGSKHTFEKDGVVLNNAGTATIQRDLILTHFGLDNDIMDVLLGETLFTRMNPTTERRDWLMRLSGSQYDYAMRIHQKLKTLWRDTQGAIKHLNKRLADEMDKLPSKEKLAELRTHGEQLRCELDNLLALRDLSLPAKASVEESLRRYNQLLNDVSTAILKADNRRPACLSHDEGLFVLIGQRREQLAQAERALKQHYEEHAKVEQLVAELNDLCIDDRESILKGFDLQRTKKNSLVYPDGFRYEAQSLEKRAATRAIRETLIDLLTQLPRVNSEVRVSTSDIQEEVDHLLFQVSELKHRVGNMQHEIGHIQKADTIHCPKCKYSWLDADPHQRLPDLVLRHQDDSAKLATLEKTLSEQQQLLETYALHDAMFRRINQLVVSNRLLQSLWEVVMESWELTSTPRSVMAILSDWERCLMLSEESDRCDSDIQRLEDALARFDNDSEANVDRYRKALKSHQEAIEQGVFDVESYRTDLKALVQYENVLATFEEKRGEFEQVWYDYDESFRTYVETVEQEGLNELISGRHSALGLIEHQLSKATLAEGIIRDMEKQKEELLRDSEAYDILIRELSPTDGLIADCLKGFIDTFAQQMTDIIRRVWTYDYTVLPCGIDKEELDYKFPIRTPGLPVPSPDVSKGSESQVDVVDFAFRIIVILYLGLEDMPFYLDEPATSLDETHRANIVMFIKEYMELRKASQLFLVSHYFQQSGAFHPAETLLVDAANIVNIPSVYNTHATIRTS